MTASSADASAATAAEISAAIIARGEALWREIVPKYSNEPLPFLQLGVEDPNEIVSHWHVTSTGNEIDDAVLGFIYASLLLHRAKTVRGNFDPFEMIVAVVRDIVKKGHFGGIEYGFFARLNMLALAASLN
jgi:hypothetical protein